MPLGAALAVVEGILSGLSDLHDARDAAGNLICAVHRDVNPSNVIVSRTGDVKIVDLGVVHVGIDGKSTTAGLKGTLAYMAPEQLLGRPVGPWTDLYSAALVAYEVFTGTAARPARMAGIAELLEARSRLPTSMCALRHDIPEALDAAVLSALDPMPDRRPSDALAWLKTLLIVAGVSSDCEGLAAIALAAAGERVRSAGTIVPGAAHAADAPARVPERDRDAGTEQGRDPRMAAAEVEVARAENDRLDVCCGVRCQFHGLR